MGCSAGEEEVGEWEYGEGVGGWPVYHFMISGFPLNEGLCLAAWQVGERRDSSLSFSLSHTHYSGAMILHSMPLFETVYSDAHLLREMSISEAEDEVLAVIWVHFYTN